MLDNTTRDMLRTDAALAEREATVEQLRRELDAAQASIVSARRAYDAQREALEMEHNRVLLAENELDAARTILIELRDIADAPGEDIRATIDTYFAKEHNDDL